MITLAEARNALREAAHNTGTSNNSYPDARIDRALLSAFAEFGNHVGLTETVGTVAIDGTVRTINIALSGFEPRNANWFQIDYHPVRHVDFATISREIINHGGTATPGTALPCLIAFQEPTGTVGYFETCPGTSYTVLTLSYNKPITTWTPGASGATEITGCPSAFEYAVARWGGMCHLETSDNDTRARRRDARDEFERLKQQARSTMSDKAIYELDAEDRL